MANLGHYVELHHGLSEGVSISSEVGHQTQHGSVEGAVDLTERGSCRVVHIDDRNMAEEPGEDGCQVKESLSSVRFLGYGMKPG